jgi:hypothetical protein
MTSVSISILLVPAVMAAATSVAAATGGRQGDAASITCRVETRMRDVTLLTQALRDTGAKVTLDQDNPVAVWDTARCSFQRGADGNWSAHFTGNVTEEQAVDLVKSIDVAYGRQVQQAVLLRIRDRAPSCGLRLESETVARDASVQLVFAVDGGDA